ncbi:MAG: glycosyltransferase family 4 protein [Myxacorys californica WJT36-NPBG1]|jgi:glycosyltransferase involved in cell wall biosynthesis|nr:glycosyltransferase family 4 protein [Myxacorys californica WJT36-NPBG1]
MFNFGFVIEQMLGHVTHGQNLKYWVSQDPSIHPTWLPIDAESNDLWEHLPVVRSNWSLKSSLRTRDAIRRALRSHSFDALFLHTQTLALLAMPFMRHIPTVISTDATPFNYDTVGAGYSHHAAGQSWLDQQKFLWNRKTFHAATAIVAFCQWVKESIVHDYGVPAEKVTVISPGLDLAQWNFDREQRSVSDPARLLFVGGDFTRKGGQTLLEAFRSGLDHNCILDIVTKDETLCRDLAGMERVHVHQGLPPNSSDLKGLYANADMFVFPTLADCYPNVILEAMASGLPIVSTDVGAISEQVQHGINGLLVPCSDSRALAAAVNELINDASKHRAMAIASRRIAEEQFDGRRNYGAITSLMKQLVEQHPEPSLLPSLR